MREKLEYLDNLKVALTLVVIFHHVGQAYAATGGFWPYMVPAEEGIPWLARTFGINSGYLMALFFMISGYFLPPSWDRRAGKGFVTTKLTHLGLPLVLGFFVLVPLVFYLYYDNFSGNPPLGWWRYYTTVYLGIGVPPDGYKAVPVAIPQMNFGWLWYVEHLLLYSLLYAGYRRVRGGGGSPLRRLRPRLRAGMPLILVQCFVITVLTVFVRRYYEIDQWVPVFGFIQMEPAHLPLYIVSLLTGLAARRLDGFATMPRAAGYASLVLALLMAAPRLLQPWLPRSVGVFIHTSWDIYESFMAVFFSWGLLVLFRETMDFRLPLLQWAGRLTFAAYILHVPIVVGWQYLVGDNLSAVPQIRFFLVLSLAIGTTFLAAGFFKKVVVVRNFLG
ncbi:MAG: acyltransferase [Planctomycetes bacterium]|nr:acyltransferase [Planctomycetota bacterium]